MHSIRLRGPWECYLPGSPEPRPVTMPAAWEELAALASSTGPLPSSISLVRRFGQPTGIGPEEQLRIIVQSVEPSLQVFLNSQLLENQASGKAHSYDVTSLLAPRNELEIRLEIPKLDAIPAPEALPVGDVRLEIKLQGDP